MGIRDARTQDLSNIVALLRRWELPTADLERARVAFLVDERDGQIAGVIGLQRFERVALLRSLAVDASRRGEGAGDRLVARLEAEARDQGIDELILLTQTAQAFFTRRGYRAIDRAAVPAAVLQTEEFRSLCPASAICMAKLLR